MTSGPDGPVKPSPMTSGPDGPFYSTVVQVSREFVEDIPGDIPEDQQAKLVKDYLLRDAVAKGIAFSPDDLVEYEYEKSIGWWFRNAKDGKPFPWPCLDDLKQR